MNFRTCRINVFLYVVMLYEQSYVLCIRMFRNVYTNSWWWGEIQGSVMELCTKPHISMNRQCCPSAGGRQLVAHDCAFVSFNSGRGPSLYQVWLDVWSLTVTFCPNAILKKHSTSSEVLARGWSGIPPR